jgi:hypothetical protein
VEYKASYTRLTQCLVERGLFSDDPFRLIDVGCSGGISKFWQIFQTSLQALGIDPVIDECDRLNNGEPSGNIRYQAAFVGLPEDHPFIQRRGKRDVWGANPWERLSACRGARILADRTKQEEKLPVLNDWNNARLADPKARLTVEQLAAQKGWSTVDFLKVDVDGHDLDVLLSGENLIRSAPVLGIAMEVNYYGTGCDTDHTFHNTDRLMREWGFELFDLTVRRYSLSALPAIFEYDVPAQTRLGRPFQGDALYLRDPGAWQYNPAAAVPLNAIQLLKLACLFAAFGLPDHAVELLRDHADDIAPLTEVAPLLHLLANEVDPSMPSYDDYLNRFESDPSAFYPSRQAP